MRFYLGTHKDSWLKRAGVPLFVSDRTLKPRKKLPRAIAPWALDSGGFTELSMRGGWVETPRAYADRARRYQEHVGSLDFASPQDWMCEPAIRAKTGRTVREHQRLTVENFLELRSIAPDVPWIPVLQGWQIRDYLQHIDDYERAGVDLTAESTVGVGTVCRRQSTSEGVGIIRTVAARGIRPHAFGFKKTGIPHTSDVLASADSMAWSLRGRHVLMPECVADPTVNHKSCANCIRFAMRWRDELLNSRPTVTVQMGLFS